MVRSLTLPVSLVLVMGLFRLFLTAAVRPQSDMPKEPLMLPIHTILHPTDFSARARSAFDLACAVA